MHGSPLAIELAAAAAHFLPCDYLADEIQNNLKILRTEMCDVPPRHRSVRAVFEHSWGSLSADEQQVFARLFVFQGGFRFAAAQTVCEIGAAELRQLTSKSLLRRVSAERYECHELLRQYALEKLSNPTRIKQQHATYYLALLRDEGSELGKDDSRNALARLQTEAKNITVAWQFSVQLLNVPDLRATLPTLVRFYRLSGDLAQYAAALTQLVTTLHQFLQQRMTIRRPHIDLLCHALAYQANALQYRGEFETAIAAATEAVEIAEELADPVALATARISLIDALYRRSRYDEMAAQIDQLEPLLPQLPDSVQKVKAHHWRGIWQTHMRQFRAAIAEHQHALASARAQRLREEESLALLNIGSQHYDMADDFDVAADYFQQGLEVAEQVGAWQRVNNALLFLTQIDYVANRPNQALERLQRVIDRSHQVGTQMRLGQPYVYMGTIKMGLDDYQSAEPHIHAALKHYRRQGQQTGEAMALYYLGKAQAGAGRYREAVATLDHAIALCKAVDLLFWEMGAAVAKIEVLTTLANELGEDRFSADAAALIQRYDEPIRNSNNSRIQVWFATACAGWHLHNGDLDQAHTAVQQAVTDSATFAPRYQVDALVQLAYVQQAGGETANARTTWQTVLSLREDLSQPIGQAEAHANLALIAREDSAESPTHPTPHRQS